MLTEEQTGTPTVQIILRFQDDETMKASFDLHSLVAANLIRDTCMKTSHGEFSAFSALWSILVVRPT